MPEEEENFAEGKLPSYFVEKGVFTNHEVYDILKSHVGTKQQDGERQWTPHPMLQKTLDYTQRFSSVKSSDAAEQVCVCLGVKGTQPPLTTTTTTNNNNNRCATCL